MDPKQKHSWFRMAQYLPKRPPLSIFLHEIHELVNGMERLLFFRPEDLKALHTRYLGKFIPYMFAEHRVFGCLWRDHRKLTELRYGLDKSQLLFVMGHTSTSTNYLLGNATQPFVLMSEFSDNPYGTIPYKVCTLMKPKSGHIFIVRQDFFFIRPVSCLDNLQPKQTPSL